MGVQEIERAIVKLPPEELAELATWFEKHQVTQWDEQIAEDVRRGKLDELISRANTDFDAGRVRRL